MKILVFLVSLIIGIGFGGMLLGLLVVVFNLELKLWIVIAAIVIGVLSTWNMIREINWDWKIWSPFLFSRMPL